MHQFFVDESQVGKEYITITGDDVRHICQVLRLKPGEKIRVSTPDGTSYYCRIAEYGDAFVQADRMDEQALPTELNGHIRLFCGIPKGDRFETVIQKAVELGVEEIIPVIMRYCVVRWDEKKAKNRIKRYQAISESAAKQSKRSIIPRILPVMSFEEAVTYAGQCDHVLVPYENERGVGNVSDVLSAIRTGDSVAVMIGPEGGFAKEEIEAAKKCAQLISLGRRILRTDTAAIAACTLVMMRLETADEDQNI